MFKKLQKLYLSVSDVQKPGDLARVINSLQANVADVVNPMATKTQNDSLILTNISLVSGRVNIINHTLGRQLAGWSIVRQRGQAQCWDSQDGNTSPNLTLLLNTSANVVVDLLVF